MRFLARCYSCAARAMVLVAATLASAPVVAATAPQAPVLSADECAVWMRELSFAGAVAAHDAGAFAEHLDAQAAFSASQREPQRGSALIAREWAEIVAGKGVKLEWYPSRVTIAGRPDIAWSSGPTLLEDLTPGAEHRYHIGAYRSVWVRSQDGVWRVMFDDGAPARPATDEQVAAFRAGRRDCTSLTSS